MGARYLTINTVIRKYQVETTRDDYLLADETDVHDARSVIAFSNAVRRGFPEAKITWGLSWQALTDPTARYAEIRDVLNGIRIQYGDDITFVPGGYFANGHNSREQVNRDMAEAVALIEAFTGGYRPRALIAGFLSAENMRYARQALGIEAAQANIWSQYSVDFQDGEGSIAYPYYPSSEHFCKPAQGAEDFIDCLNLDGWTVDLVAARLAGEYRKHGVRYCSRMGVGPLETLHTFDLETGLREMQATTEAHFCDQNVARNPFGWVTNNYEICEVTPWIARGALDAFSEWIAWIHRTWPDVECPTMAEFGAAVRAAHPDNETLRYVLRQQGSGIGASFAGQEVTWFMNREFRLGIVVEADRAWVFDYTDYRRQYVEPLEIGHRDWSIFGEINQKGLRPQDRPVLLAEFLEGRPELAEQLQIHPAERRALAQLIVPASLHRTSPVPPSGCGEEIRHVPSRICS